MYDGDGRRIVERETLSTYPFNYEYTNWRKRRDVMLKPDGNEGNDNTWYWLATLIYDCPIQPDVFPSLVPADGQGAAVVDVVPICTPARFSELYFRADLAGEAAHTGTEFCNKEGRNGEDPNLGCKGKDLQGWDAFDADTKWGVEHVLPAVEASDRWVNIPVRRPKTTTTSSNAVRPGCCRRRDHRRHDRLRPPAHTLVACTWASISFLCRGNNSGFDHVYVNENSGTFTKLDRYLFDRRVQQQHQLDQKLCMSTILTQMLVRGLVPVW